MSSVPENLPKIAHIYVGPNEEMESLIGFLDFLKASPGCTYYSMMRKRCIVDGEDHQFYAGEGAVDAPSTATILNVSPNVRA